MSVKGIRRAALFLALLALLLPVFARGEALLRYGEPPEGFSGLEVRFLDIGVGDGIYLRCGEETMLVDGGLKRDADRVFKYFEAQGIAGVTYMVNTHCHNDHVGGPTRLLKLGFTAEKGLSIYRPDQRTALFAAFAKALKRRGASYRMVADGEELTLGDAKIQFMRCTDSAALRIANENSLVMRVSYGERTLLLPADIGGAAQRKLANRYGEKLRAEVVKSAHHGQALFVKEWLDAVRPSFVVCTGKRGNVENFVKQLEREKLPVLYAPEGVVHLAADGDGWYIWQTGHMGKDDEKTVVYP